ncbi:DUF6090 family protein [Gaetbulibacter sp. M240]|uniref:DUF6090 family protein n=1 Tax=Gaetbulibacter sp. M240 TaxID=3126511 RepID=UPI00374F73A5
MINFFRNIRQKLLGSNQFNKYLLYAIGEIILVVIGILIALQINNWNESRKERIKETYYLKSVNTSIDLSQRELLRVINDSKEISDNADELLNLLAEKEFDRLNGIGLDSLLFNAADWSIISLNDAGIREILNTGALDVIKDEDIRVILASWDERLHKIKKFENETEYIAHNYAEHISGYTDVSLIISDSSKSAVIPEKREMLLHDPQLRNYLFHIAFSHRDMNDKYIKEKVFLDSLHTMIDVYLKDRN